MITTLLSLLVAASFGFSPSLPQLLQENLVLSGETASTLVPIYPPIDIKELKRTLQQQAPTMSNTVLNKVVTALKCTHSYRVDNNNILSVIDYSLPSNQKRLWIFDLAQKKLLFNTYVSHGIKSGTLLTNFFSNKYNSKASSIGVYKTEQSYYGREGLSLRLTGLDRSFNDNAMNRAIVMHGGWYMDEDFIKRYGRPGRSWGCPAVPLNMYKAVINTIKENSLLVVYYPNDNWFAKSKYLTCDKSYIANKTSNPVEQLPVEVEHRDDVFFAQVYKGGEDKPILVMPAQQYIKLFNTQVPLERMLRRQINQQEYIALSHNEINQVVAHNSREGFSSMFFVIATLHNVRGYYETVMKPVHLGTIKNMHANTDSASRVKSYTVHFEKTPSVQVQSTNKFIRWLGL